VSRRQLRLTRTLIALALLTLLVIRVAHVVGARADADPPASSTATSSTSPSPAVTQSSAQPAAGGVHAAPTTYADDSWLPAARGPGHLAPGSDPSALPGPILIADKKNNRLVIVDPQGRVRWVFPRPGDLGPGQTFTIPDDAFFSPDGKEIIATQEDDFVVSLIDIATHRIVYRYGHPGVAGGTANHLDNPDDAMLLPDGTIVLADIKNCRVISIAKGKHVPARVIGQGGCIHHPPTQWGSPNGAFPMNNGHWLVTEINGDWVSELEASGRVLWSTHPPGVGYPSDSNEISANRYLTVDYSTPGQLVVFNRQGKVLWRFAPKGVNALNHPSLALPLPNGMILVNDDRNHRVIVVDPKTNRIVWQYGHTHVHGRAPGYLDNPDGVDLVAPYALLTRHASTLTSP
jgi:DNA-binding beta-propeller fold protein YncE